MALETEADANGVGLLIQQLAQQEKELREARAEGEALRQELHDFRELTHQQANAANTKLLALEAENLRLRKATREGLASGYVAEVED